MRYRVRLPAVLALLLSSAALSGPASVEVEGLMGAAAVLQIDGQRRLLKPGESFSGVTLVRTEGAGAVLEIEGRQHVVGLSQRVGTVFESPAEQRVAIPRDANHQYITTAAINGRIVRVMIDTGANMIAMSSVQAQSMGIDFRGGEQGLVETASGRVNAWTVTLDSVSVGDIRVNAVKAAVVEGDYPSTLLLGMSYLRHVKIEEVDGVLSLSRLQ